MRISIFVEFAKSEKVLDCITLVFFSIYPLLLWKLLLRKDLFQRFA